MGLSEEIVRVIDIGIVLGFDFKGGEYKKLIEERRRRRKSMR